MEFVDTHCHLNFPQYRRDMEKTVLRSMHADLKYLINVGTNFTTSQESINLASRYKSIYAAVGVHPHDAKLCAGRINTKLIELLRSPKIVALGEIGLDYYRNLSNQDAQREIFAEQLVLAQKANLPIILHCRDAYMDLLKILDQNFPTAHTSFLPGVVHSFSSGPGYLQEFLRRGFYIGFNGMITYPGNTTLQATVEATPLNRILLETDAPFLPPQTKRGERNEPSFVKEVAVKIAEIKGVSLLEVAKQTTENAETLFKLK